MLLSTLVYYKTLNNFSNRYFLFVWKRLFYLGVSQDTNSILESVFLAFGIYKAHIWTEQVWIKWNITSKNDNTLISLSHVETSKYTWNILLLWRSIYCNLSTNLKQEVFIILLNLCNIHCCETTFLEAFYIHIVT